jgi:hypothetical protein
MTNASQVATGSGLSGFVDSYGDHVFYVGPSTTPPGSAATLQDVHHLKLTAGSWVDSDLTATTPGPQAAAASALSSFGDSYGDHVVYLTADQHVHQLYFDNVNWVDQDLTATATPVEESTVPLTAVGSALSSLANTLGELIFYISADQHVHLLVDANSPPGVSLLAVACPAVTVGEVGVQYSSNLVASGGTSPYTYAIASGLPPGLSLNTSTGAITGTPTTAGSFSFTVKVTDGAGAAATTNGCQITINRAIVSVACPGGGEVGQAYSSNLTASGAASPYTYAIASGSLPPGLSLNASTGAITGTPMAAGTFTFTATATSATGVTGQNVCAIVIESGVTLSCPSANTGVGGEAYSSNLVASGGASPYTYAIASGNLPPGLSLNTSTGAITGTPTTLGTFNFTASATDATGAMATSNCGIAISGTFVINAILWDNGPSGPAGGLSFINYQSGQPVTFQEGTMAGTTGTYTVTGVTNGEELAVHTQGITLCDSSGVPSAPPWITVTLSGTSGSTTIYVKYASAL